MLNLNSITIKIYKKIYFKNAKFKGRGSRAGPGQFWFVDGLRAVAGQSSGLAGWQRAKIFCQAGLRAPVTRSCRTLAFNPFHFIS